MYDKSIHILVEEKTREAIRKIAYKRDIKISDAVRLAIKEFIENEKKREIKKK
jgi:antitoxin component of RelBE/YafQ-DinJ toxin-antitoxin module